MPKTTLGLVSDSRVTSRTVRYSERLWVRWWWWPVGLGVSAVLATEVNMGVRGLPDWLPYAVLGIVAVGALLWLSRVEIQVVGTGEDVELLAGQAHLPASVVARTAAIPDRRSRPPWAASWIRPRSCCTEPGSGRWCWWFSMTRTIRRRTGWSAHAIRRS